MAKKSRIDKQIEKEEKEDKLPCGIAAIQERRRSLENLQRVKKQHQAYVAQHGRTWLNHSLKH
jgi:hypothetical protein